MAGTGLPGRRFPAIISQDKSRRIAAVQAGGRLRVLQRPSSGSQREAEVGPFLQTVLQ